MFPGLGCLMGLSPLQPTAANRASDRTVRIGATPSAATPATGSATAEQAAAMGNAWVGEGAALASDGKTMVSADGLRQYRPPSYKPNLGRVQANLEGRSEAKGAWQSNAHVDIAEKK
jgi:hypothetical protein